MNSTARMPPNHQFMLNSLPIEPVSRTYQYRKIMKPMLERKRRARINKCLDELKDLMTGTLQADGENVSKLEKADILELTVRHLQRLRAKNALFVRHNDSLNMEKFWAGFQHCAGEVAQFLSKYDRNVTGDLIQYIANYVPNVAITSSPVSIMLRQTLNVPSTTREALQYQRLINSSTKITATATATATASTTSSTSTSTYCTNEYYGNQQQPNRCPYANEALMKKEVNDIEKGNVWRPW
uniref:BHLH domain-containing protein n=1 Tax=Glossina austeni TaxID=7395 RepID=A0A1A9V6S8_GLOAU